MTFQVRTAKSMKMAVFWDAAPSSLVILTDVSEELSASIVRAMSELRMAVSSSKTSVNMYQTT
jgi:hypothetical protein